MKLKAKVKIAVDALMTLGLLFLMGYQFWGDVAHEWAGAGMFVLFILHHALNGGWYKSLFRGKYTPFRVFQIVVDVLVLLDMLALMVSGVILSNHVFAFLPIQGGMSFARTLHMLASFWGFLLLALHLGLHWNVFLGMARKAPAFQKPSRRRAIVLNILGGAVALYGVVAFFRRDLPMYLFLRTHFVFFDFSEPIPFSMWTIWPLWGCSSFWPTLRQSCCGKGFIIKRKNDKEESLVKKNLGNALALYPTPLVVVGTMVNGKPNWVLVGHLGIMGHDHVMVSLAKPHYTNQGIKESKALSINIVDEALLPLADKAGCVSGAKEDKSQLFAYTLGESGAPMIDNTPVVMECQVEVLYETPGFDNFICTIQATFAEKSLLNQQGKLDYHTLKPVLFEMPTYEYMKTGDVLAKCMSFGKAQG